MSETNFGVGMNNEGEGVGGGQGQSVLGKERGSWRGRRISPVLGGIYLVAGTFLVTATYGLTNKLWAPRLAMTSVNTNVLDVSGESRVKVSVGEVTGVVGVSSDRDTSEEAKAEVDTTIAGIVAELRAIGIQDQNIQTDNYSIYPNYDWSDGTGRTVIGYNVNTQITIKADNVEMMNQAIDAAARLGATQVGQVAFQVGDAERERAEMEGTREAFEKAKQKAQSLAEMAGLRLDKVVNIYSYCSGNEWVRPMYAMAEAKDMNAGGGTALEAGSEEVSCTTSVTYQLK